MCSQEYISELYNRVKFRLKKKKKSNLARVSFTVYWNSFYM